ncbi:MAG: hypothetical protein ABGX36_08020 [Cycloclasticus sp.]
MNQEQKRLSRVISVIIGLIVAFPPYVVTRGIHVNSIDESGYDFIFALPSRATVNVSTLFAEMVGVLIIGAILFFVAKENNE